MGKNVDRFGFEHCGAYRAEDYELCPKCKGRCVTDPNYNKNGKTCNKCGGYGEVRRKVKYAG